MFETPGWQVVLLKWFLGVFSLSGADTVQEASNPGCLE